MPSTSAPVDPNTTGHPVALTKGAEGGDAGAGSAAPGSVSFGTASMDFATAGASTSAQIASASRGVSFASGEEEKIVGGDDSQAGAKTEKSLSATGNSAGGLFTAPDFNAGADPTKEEDVLSPTEVKPGDATSADK